MNESAARTGNTQRPPVRGLLGRALSKVYEVELNRRSRRFDAGVGVHRLDRPVISVGNLSVGGTGKTPTVTAVSRWLLEAGHRPCIAMRGYRARDGESDEAMEYRQLIAGVPVVAKPDRRAGLNALFASPEGRGVDCVVLDDGLQHRRLARDLDIVLVDATRDPFADRLLPAGWLRERPEALRRAQAVVVTHAERVGAGVVERLFERLARINAQMILLSSWHHWSGLSVCGFDGAVEHQPVSWLEGRRVLAVCGIGNGSAFVAAAEGAAGSALAGAIVLRDHAHYDRRTLERIVRTVKQTQADVILTTRKDNVKLSAWAPNNGLCPVATAELEIRFDRGKEALRERVLGVVATGSRIP